MQTASQGREKEKKYISGAVKSSAGLGRGCSGELQHQGKPGSSEWSGRGLREELGDVFRDRRPGESGLSSFGVMGQD